MSIPKNTFRMISVDQELNRSISSYSGMEITSATEFRKSVTPSQDKDMTFHQRIESLKRLKRSKNPFKMPLKSA